MAYFELLNNWRSIDTTGRVSITSQHQIDPSKAEVRGSNSQSLRLQRLATLSSGLTLGTDCHHFALILNGQKAMART